ncbi:hypothetical protein RND81_07G030000 [Saponaria officinalis]|uniref:BED-type domain-containing protein n=1 Tax=Saponaria officinalis TaxID=3572 RepID=A0AAW1JN60_SAPOF
MSSSYNDNSQRVVDLDEYTSEANFEEMPNKKMKEDPKGSTNQKRARPPRTPTVSFWSPGQPFVKTRKNRSPYWEHYIQGDVIDTAKCVYCGTVVTCQTKNGTTTLQNHADRCKNMPANIDKK